MEVWINALGSALGLAILGGTFELIKWALNRRAEKEDRAEDRKNELEDRAEAEQSEAEESTEDKINSIITIVKGIQEAERYMTRLEIERRADEYLTRGSKTSKEMREITQMHSIYHECLNGNGYLDDLMENIRALPIKN